MPRLLFATAVLAILPALSRADGPVQYVVPGEAKPARPEVRPASFVTPSTGSTVILPGHGPLVPGYESYGLKLQAQLWWDRHECAPDGCIKPIGCGNFWTEKKFVFGSCRQFFGTAESTVGHHKHTRERDR